MANDNKGLTKAKNLKSDDFYTQLTDIERELKHYRHHFEGKIVLCNCDDPRVSNFFYYFSYNFERLKLKKLITTCYKNQEMDLFSQNNSEKAIFLEYEGDLNENHLPDKNEIEVKYLRGDGDFRNQENIELLKTADIVVTNPPFSLFREYVAQLIEYDKKFIIIGSQNAFTYKEIFRLLKENKIWTGVDNGGTKWFEVPMEYEIKTKSRIMIKDDKKFFSMGSIYWFTNLDIAKRHEDIILYKKYYGNENFYQKYENYNAININRVSDIPADYDGFMGVPITFLDKYNPEQFEIVGLGISTSGIEIGVQPYKPEHRKYRKEVQKRGVVDGDLYLLNDGKVEVPYARIIIKNRRIV